MSCFLPSCLKNMNLTAVLKPFTPSHGCLIQARMTSSPSNESSIPTISQCIFIHVLANSWQSVCSLLSFQRVFNTYPVLSETHRWDSCGITWRTLERETKAHISSRFSLSQVACLKHVCKHLESPSASTKWNQYLLQEGCWGHRKHNKHESAKTKPNQTAQVFSLSSLEH